MNKKLQPGGFITNPTYLQIIQPHLKWLLGQREKTTDKNERVGINAAIILFSSIYLEGFLEDVLSSFIWYYSDPITQKKAGGLAYVERISSLEEYKKAFTNLGVSLNNVLNKRDSEDIDHIFKFRNLLAHGQRDSYSILHDGDWTAKEVVGSYYKDIESFFIKRRVIKRWFSAQPDISALFSDETATWIYAKMKELSIKILKNISNGIEMNKHSQKFRLDLIKNSLERLE